MQTDSALSQEALPSKVFFIVAGETSGDLHGARLMRSLRAQFPNARFEGIGGERMTAEGLHSMVPLSDINVVGFWEVAKRYGSFRALLEQCKTRLQSTAYSAFIPVDYPGFNLRLARHAKSCGIPVCWYIAPQLWAWGEHRAEELRAVCDVLMVVFPFEEEFFAKHRITTRFVGHPLLDDSAFSGDILPLEQRTKTIALLPGSRLQEVERNLPLQIAMANALSHSIAEHTFTIAQSPNVPEQVYKRLTATCKAHIEFTNDSRTLLRTARAGVIKTGTSTLEAGLLGLPFVMMYRTSWVSYLLAKRVITLPSIALVNIITREPIVKELIQENATVASLSEEVMHLLTSPNYAAYMQEKMRYLRVLLGHSEYDAPASVRASQAIAEFCR